MRTSDFTKPVTARSLNESLANQFGETIDVNRFSLEQLYDARNKLRTKLSQIETNENYNATKSETYQKNKLFLDVLNTAIDERIVTEKAESENQAIAARIALKHKKEGTKPKAGTASAEMMKMSKSDLEDFTKAKKGAPKKKNESVVREGAEDKAELIMAAKDMVDRLTGWMEDTAEMQTESMLELADAIRDELGQEQSDSFVNSVKPALEQLYSSMETTRGTLTQGVSMIAGEGEMPTPMGAEEEPEMEPVDDIDTEEPETDDFAASEPAAGGEEEAGREKRESVERSRKLGTILSKKK